MTQLTLNKVVEQTGLTQMDPQVPNTHDLRVVLFHVLLAGAQAVLLQLGKENFGVYTVYIALFVQVAGEFLRRIVI